MKTRDPRISRRQALVLTGAAGWALGMRRPVAGAGQPGRDLLGQPAKAWRVENWLNSKPLTLADLRGRVVLVRWWTAPGCSFCAATAPALNEFHETYGDRGLAVLGFYHHKSAVPLSADHVKSSAERFGFRFPLATDPQWRTLKQWWLAGADREFTSVSFLLGRDGRIRHIHPGGEYVKGDADYATMKRKIEELLAEPPPGAL